MLKCCDLISVLSPWTLRGWPAPAGRDVHVLMRPVHVPHSSHPALHHTITPPFSRFFTAGSGLLFPWRLPSSTCQHTSVAVAYWCICLVGTLICSKINLTNSFKITLAEHLSIKIRAVEVPLFTQVTKLHKKDQRNWEAERTRICLKLQN